MASTMRFDRWEDTLGNLVAANSVPRGIVTTTAGGTNNKGYIRKPNNQAISSTTAVDITDTSMTFVATAGRLYRASWSGYIDNTGSTARFNIRITDGVGTLLHVFQNQVNSIWARGSFSDSHIFTASGTTTMKLQFTAVEGTFNIYGVSGDSPSALSFIIEDIGPA